MIGKIEKGKGNVTYKKTHQISLTYKLYRRMTTS